MRVTLIDYTGKDSEDDEWYAARQLIYTKNTRLTQGEETRKKIDALDTEDMLKELTYMVSTIRSSWEFCDYTFEIKDVTRAFTHQLVRTRTGSYAQQSQRSINMVDFKFVTPPSINTEDRKSVWLETMAAIREGYAQLQALDVPSEDCRGLLPTNVCTNIIAKFNLRSLSDLVGKRLNPRAQGEYTEVIRAMVKEVEVVHPWAMIFLMPKGKETPALYKLVIEALNGRVPAQVPELNDALKEIDKLKETWGA